MLLYIALALCLSRAAASEMVAASVGQAGTPASPPKLSKSEIADLAVKAEAGDAKSQVALGRAFEDGNGVPQSDDQAVAWYNKAAAAGDADGLNDLGHMYWSGRGVERDKAKAVQWYEKSARIRNPRALYNLGMAYYNGEGVPRINRVTAYAWFLLAEEAGNAAAAEAVSRLESEMKPGGVGDGLMKIAEMYEQGDGVEQDFSASARWYRRAAERGDPIAQVKLSEMLMAGRGIPRNYEEARRWCQAAAEKGFPPGMYCLGHFAQTGLAGPSDLSAAFHWFELGARQEHAPAMLEVGRAYWEGRGVKKDRVKAYMWVLMAYSAALYHRTDAGDAAAQATLLRTQMSDREVEKARQEAQDYSKKRPGFPLREPRSN